MKRCTNCEWNISPVEEEIIREQRHIEGDSSRQKKGIHGNVHNNKFACEYHTYCGIDKDNTYVLYDDKYLGPGYFIITEYNGEIIKFLKIYITNNNGIIGYSIRGYEDSFLDELHRKIVDIKVFPNTELFKVVSTLARQLNGKSVFTVSPNIDGQSSLSAEIDEYYAHILLSKDVSGTKSTTKFIDLSLRDTLTCSKYQEFATFFRNLAKISTETAKENTVKKILKISK